MKNARKWSWIERALNMSEHVELLGAPSEIQQLAYDAVQHFVWAKDCRHQNYLGAPGWGPKADKANRQGKKAFAAAKAWVEANRPNSVKQ